MGTGEAASRFAFGEASCGCADAGRLAWALIFFFFGGQEEKKKKEKEKRIGEVKEQPKAIQPGMFWAFGLGFGVCGYCGFRRRGARRGGIFGAATAPGEQRERTAAGPEPGGSAPVRRSGGSGALGVSAGAARAGRRGAERRVLWWALCFPQVTAA